MSATNDLSDPRLTLSWVAPLAAPYLWAVGRRDPDEERTDRDERNRSRGPAPWLSLSSLRGPILFIVGLAGIAHQTLVADQVHWELLLLFGAMLGLELPLRADQQRREGGS